MKMKLLLRLALLSLFLLVTGATALAQIDSENPAGAGRERTPLEGATGQDQFNYLPIMPSQDIIACRFREQDGVLIMEVESADRDTNLWEFRSTIPGYTGSGYYVWVGPPQYATPGVGILTYPLITDQPGDFLLRIHNYHDHPENDLENDVFARLDGSPWMKVFSFPNEQWTWYTSFDPPGPGITDAIYYNVPAGNHYFQLSARSPNFRIDRITLFRFDANGLDLSLPESPCY
jgi:hypothetical protein